MELNDFAQKVKELRVAQIAAATAIRKGLPERSRMMEMSMVLERQMDELVSNLLNPKDEKQQTLF